MYQEILQDEVKFGHLRIQTTQNSICLKRPLMLILAQVLSVITTSVKQRDL